MNTLFGNRVHYPARAVIGMALVVFGVRNAIAQDISGSRPKSAMSAPVPAPPPEALAALQRFVVSKARPQAADRRVIEGAVNTLRAARKGNTQQPKSAPRLEMTPALEASLRQRREASSARPVAKATASSTPKPLTDEALLSRLPRPAAAKPKESGAAAGKAESTIRGDAGRAPLGTQAPAAGRTPLGTQAPDAGRTPLGTQTPAAGRTPLGTQTPAAGRTPLGTQTPAAGRTPLGTAPPAEPTARGARPNGSQ